MAESDILAVTSGPQQADSSRQWYQLRCRVTSGPHKLGIFDCKLCKESVLPIGRFRGNPAKGLWLVEDVEVSSKHAELRLQEVTRDLVLRDIGSTNGSFINGNRVPAFTNSTVSIGDEIKLGKTTLYFAKLQPIEYSSDTPRAVVEFTPAEAQTEEGNQLTNRVSGIWEVASECLLNFLPCVQWSTEHPDPGIPNGRPNATDTEADTSEHSRGLYDYSEYDCPHCGKALGAMKPASRIRHVRNCATKSPSKRRKRKAVPKKQQKRPSATTEGRQKVSAKSPLDRPPVLLIEQNEDFISVGPIAPPRLKAKRGQQKKSKKAKRRVTDRELPRDSNTNAGVDPSQEIPVPTKLPSDSEAALGKKQEEAEGEEHSKKSVVAELSSFRFNGMLTAKADVDIHSSMAESATATGRSSHKSSHAEGDDVGQENLEALQSEIAAVDEEIASLRARWVYRQLLAPTPTCKSAAHVGELSFGEDLKRHDELWCKANPYPRRRQRRPLSQFPEPSDGKLRLKRQNKNMP